MPRPLSDNYNTYNIMDSSDIAVSSSSSVQGAKSVTYGYGCYA